MTASRTRSRTDQPSHQRLAVVLATWANNLRSHRERPGAGRTDPTMTVAEAHAWKLDAELDLITEIQDLIAGTAAASEAAGPGGTEALIGLVVPACCLQPGDRIAVAPRLVRTVSHLEDSGYVNARDVPILTVRYREGPTRRWSGGNTWAADSPVPIGRPGTARPGGRCACTAVANPT